MLFSAQYSILLWTILYDTRTCSKEKLPYGVSYDAYTRESTTEGSIRP
jgi:hypothetical protein